MKIWKYLTPDHIFLNEQLADKASVLRFAADMFAYLGSVTDRHSAYAGMMAREEVMSTGIGNGISIPHTACSEAERLAILLIRLPKPIDFEALDALPVDIVLALIVPKNETALHLQVLAGISKLCRNPEFPRLVRCAQTSEDLSRGLKNLEEGMPPH